MAYERYRIWKKDGTYETAVAENRHEAIGIVIGRGTPRSKLMSVSKATQRGRMFQIHGAQNKARVLVLPVRH